MSEKKQFYGVFKRLPNGTGLNAVGDCDGFIKVFCENGSGQTVIRFIGARKDLKSEK